MNIPTKRKEGIREWYDRTTKMARKSLLIAAISLTSFSVVFYVLASQPLLTKLQTFNGAITIPGFGALWLGTFICIWMLPIREVSFRSHEAMEKMEARADGMQDRIDKIMDKFEKKLDSITDEDIKKMKKILDKGAKSVTPLPYKRRDSNEIQEKELTQTENKK